MAESTVPQFVGYTPSSICSLLNRPVIMTGLFRDIIIKHFQADRVEDPALRDLIWREGRDTGILVESIHRWTPGMTEKRPGVVIKRHAYRNRRVGINDQNNGNPINRDGNTTYETFWLGAHTLFCLGEEGAQAEVLSTEVQRELTQFGPAIRKSMGLNRFQVTEVGAIAQLAEAARTFVVPVTVAYAYSERWTLIEQATRLKRISLRLVSEC